jgi:HEAT repeat protein
MALLKSRTQTETQAPGVTSERREADGDLRTPAQQLLDDHAGTRRRAAQTLAADPSSAGLLATRLAVEDSPTVRAAILDALIAQRTPDVIEVVLPLLGSESAPVRNGVIEVLQQMPELVAPKIDRLLVDPSPDVRIFTVNVLESLRHPSVVAWLVRVVEQDPHVNVCATAIDLLGEVGDHTALPALHAVKRRFAGEPFIEFAVAVALGQIE